MLAIGDKVKFNGLSAIVKAVNADGTVTIERMTRGKPNGITFRPNAADVQLVERQNNEDNSKGYDPI